MENKILNIQDFPSPKMVENPQLLSEFTKPSAPISTNSFSDEFCLKFEGKADVGAPEIATITEQAGPNDSISIYGIGFDGAKIYAYGLSKGKGEIRQLNITLQRDDFVNAVIPADFDYTMYLVWIKGKDGKVSAPVKINTPKLTYVSAEKISENAELRVYGRFLTANNADGKDAKSNVFLTKGNEAFEANVLEASPYRLKIKLPKGLKDGEKYALLVHNGHGGEYGFSNPLEILYKREADNLFTGKKHTVKVTYGMSSDQEILDAINNANDGDSIYLPAGIYAIRNQIKIEKSIKFVGESKENTIFVCLFAQEECEQTTLVYGDVYSNYNGSPTAAFAVHKTPCEFKEITFTEYIEGAKYCEDIKKPTSYHIDYAHGMFIRGMKTENDGSQISLKIDSCNFTVRRTYSHARCIFTSAQEAEMLHEQFEKKYEYYSRAKMASAPVWLATDRTEIVNCIFETPKEIFMDGMHDGYIHHNTLIGTWVICGNSGPCAIQNNEVANMDISDNRIFGKDEIIKPDGFVQTGDLTFARTIVFQKAWDYSRNIYVMNNHASRVGELNYNSGEHILFEDEGITYIGKAELIDNNMTLKIKVPEEKWNEGDRFTGYFTRDDGSIRLGHTRGVTGQLVIISKGRGQGQWRNIAKATPGLVTVDRPWDVEPDENSVFVIVPGFANCVVYANKIEGPKLYYKNYNSTNGVNAYGTMANTVIDRNDFSQMQVGLAINPHYNMKLYEYNGETVRVDYNFIMFTELLVMNNHIHNTRYGIWNFPTFTMSGTDPSTAEPDVYLQIGSILRNNTVSDQRHLTGGADTNDRTKQQPDLLKRGGVSIIVGRDYWDPSQPISARDWMSEIVVENNSLNNAENGYFDISFSQNNTVIRNNSFDGKTGLTFNAVNIKHNPHVTGEKPKDPVFFE